MKTSTAWGIVIGLLIALLMVLAWLLYGDLARHVVDLVLQPPGYVLGLGLLATGILLAGAIAYIMAHFHDD